MEEDRENLLSVFFLGGQMAGCVSKLVRDVGVTCADTAVRGEKQEAKETIHPSSHLCLLFLSPPLSLSRLGRPQREATSRRCCTTCGGAEASQGECVCASSFRGKRLKGQS